jgi:hypothetical protein
MSFGQVVFDQKGATALNITTLSIMTLIIQGLNVTLSISEIQHKMTLNIKTLSVC